MTPDEVKNCVADIEACKGDSEAAHSMEDDLYFDVLASIAADLCANSKECADEATKSKDIDFQRWCA